MRSLLLVVLFFLSILQAKPQGVSVDSLKSGLANAKKDEKIEVIQNLIEYYRPVNSDSSSYYIEEGIRLAKQYQAPKATLAELLTQRSISCIRTGQIEQSIAASQEAISLAKQVGDTARQAAAIMMFGLAHQQAGDYTKSIESYLQALELAELAQHDDYAANATVNLANLYNQKEQYEKAFVYYEKARKLFSN